MRKQIVKYNACALTALDNPARNIDDILCLYSCTTNTHFTFILYSIYVVLKKNKEPVYKKPEVHIFET